MNHPRHSRRLLLLPLLGALLQPLATAGTGQNRPLPDPSLGRLIAAQGNRALVQIRAEARPVLQLPALSAATR